MEHFLCFSRWEGECLRKTVLDIRHWPACWGRQGHNGVLIQTSKLNESELGSDRHDLGRWINSQEEIWLRASISNSACQKFKDERIYHLKQGWRGCDGLWHLINSLPSKRTCVWHLWFSSDPPVWWTWGWSLLPNYLARLHAKRLLSHWRLPEIQIFPTGDPR